MNILKCLSIVAVLSAISAVDAAEGVSFQFRPLLAGRASLTESSAKWEKDGLALTAFGEPTDGGLNHRIR